MKHIIHSLFLLTIVLTAACNPEEKSTKQTDENIFLKPSHAKLFEIQTDGDDFLLHIYSKERRQMKEYRLSPASKANAVHIPAQKILCLSTTHLGFIIRLDERGKVQGVGGSDYIYDSGLRQAVTDGKIIDVGYEGNLNWEKIIEMKPDLITGFEIEGEFSNTAETAKRYGIPYIAVYEYAEPSALGQAEWIKLFGLLTGKYEESLQLFEKTATHYSKLKQSVSEISQKPVVLLNMPWKGTWYLPAGSSNIAQLIKDAGGEYFREDLKGEHNVPADPETVFLEADKIDIWLHPGQAGSLQEILQIDKRLKRFKAFHEGNVYNRNARLSPTGGNDFMESGIANPDRILADLIAILHQNQPQDSLFYYKQLK